MLRKIALVAAAIVPAFVYLIWVAHYSVDVPTSDDWNMVPLASSAINHTVTLKQLWGQYGDTRLFVAKLIFATSGSHDHFNVKHLVLLGAGVYIAAFVLLLFAFRAYLRRPLTFIPVLALGVVWFSVADVENALWGFQLAWYLVVFFFVAMT